MVQESLLLMESARRDVPLQVDTWVQRGEQCLCGPVQATVSAGEVWQVLGPNGTGKTTLLLMLAGVLPVHQGRLDWGGQGARDWPVLWQGHLPGCSALLSVLDNLQFLLGLSGQAATMDQMLAALEQVGLAGYEQVRLGELSAGQKRRVGLARLWLPQTPPLWLLDEPLTALDVQMVARLQARLRTYAQAGGRVVLTSHQPMACVSHRLDLGSLVAGALA
jgi:heme exporter protein A